MSTATTTTLPDVANVTALLRDAEDRTPRTIRRLIKQEGFTLETFAPVVGLSRQTLSNRLSGTTVLSHAEVVAIAYALGVPAHVLDMEPSDAVIWVAEHCSDLLNRGFGWCCDSRRLAA